MNEHFRSFLVCQSGTRSCGFPLEHVVEIMRALPVETFPDMPQFVLGIAQIRGAMVPVVDLARLLGLIADHTPSRYVTVRLNQRRVAFAAESVIGLRILPVHEFVQFPSLLGEAGHDFVSAISTLDADLFMVLEAARIIPESAWSALEKVLEKSGGVV